MRVAIALVLTTLLCARHADGQTGTAAVVAKAPWFGLSLPGLLRAQTAPRRAKSCIVLFLMGGPPQHST